MKFLSLTITTRANYQQQQSPNQDTMTFIGNHELDTKIIDKAKGIEEDLKMYCPYEDSYTSDFSTALFAIWQDCAENGKSTKDDSLDNYIRDFSNFENFQGHIFNVNKERGLYTGGGRPLNYFS